MLRRLTPEIQGKLCLLLPLPFTWACQQPLAVIIALLLLHCHPGAFLIDRNVAFWT